MQSRVFVSVNRAFYLVLKLTFIFVCQEFDVTRLFHVFFSYRIKSLQI